jgi:putative oxidoreductase
VTLRRLLLEPFTQPLAQALLLLFVRIALAGPFFLSGRTKIEEGTLFSISDSTYDLFESEYAGVPLPHELAANMATTAEHLLPALLVTGLGTRFAALGLLGMTMVIQIFVYPDAWWGTHMTWVALALALLLLGPGRLSLDHMLFDRRGS